MTHADQAFTDYQTHGRPEDLARVFDACAPPLLLLANHVAGDGGSAEDLVQSAGTVHSTHLPAEHLGMLETLQSVSPVQASWQWE